MRAPRTARTRLRRVLLAAACAAPLAATHAAAVTAGGPQRMRPAAPRWHVPTYKGITLKRSTRRDVRRILGRPSWSGHPEDEVDNPVMNMLRDEFENVPGFDGRVAVNMRRRGRVVESIELVPRYDRRPAFEEAAAEYGRDYVERSGEMGPCPTPAELRAGRTPPPGDSLVFRVYPHKGYYIAVEGGRFREIVFLSRCP